MARTIRRKHYIPTWVTQTWEWRLINDTDSPGYRQLEGEELAKQLRWWHEDKSCFWGTRPPKCYRQMHEERHRATARNELERWIKNEEHPVQLERKAKLGYWD